MMKKKGRPLFTGGLPFVTMSDPVNRTSSHIIIETEIDYLIVSDEP